MDADTTGTTDSMTAAGPSDPSGACPTPAVPRFSLSEKIKAELTKKLLGYLDKDPLANASKVISLVRRLDVTNTLAPQLRVVDQVLADPTSPWPGFVEGLWADIDPRVRAKLLENLIVNASIVGYPRQREVEAQQGCNVPWAILMDPTSACNLRCTGCWAAEYGARQSLTFEEMDSVVRQGTAMGTYVYLFTGGEPLVRKRDIIRLCEAHPDCFFTAFTNGTLIDEAFADEMLRVGNFAPAISVEGFEEATDSRRGTGTYAAVMRAMGILRERGLLFGASCCYTSANTEVIGSEAFIDHLIDCGVKFAWFFTYMPVGTDAVPELIATADQRAFMYRQLRRFRQEKPLFTIDFWNDGEFVGGCIAGGRVYCHINAAGDVEPCAFIHYSDSNIRQKTLLEAYRSPLFMGYRTGQPFNDNMLRPCPLLDNEDALTRIVEESGAHSTDLESPEDVHELTCKCRCASRAWEPVAAELWCENRAARAQAEVSLGQQPARR